jgi:hypothetical protein
LGVGLTTTPVKNKLLRDLKKQQLGPIKDKWGRMTEAFEDGQGPHRAVESVMMTMNINFA